MQAVQIGSIAHAVRTGSTSKLAALHAATEQLGIQDVWLSTCSPQVSLLISVVYVFTYHAVWSGLTVTLRPVHVRRPRGTL
jgi:hypothetical protein